MNDASSEVIALRLATRQLQHALCAMTLTEQNAEQIRDAITKLQTATNNLKTWLNDHKVL